MMRFEAQVRARPPEVTQFIDRLAGFFDRAGVDQRAAHHVAMILDELLTNLGTHGGVTETPAAVAVAVEPACVRVEFRDSGPPFDPRSAPDPDVTAPIEERDIGGLELFLMRKIASDLYYQRDDGQNCITFAVPRT
jgi:anti-sigma regulatory factor (Ser/Thr protein kinase)